MQQSLDPRYVYHVNAKGIKRLVLDLGMKKINAADIEYITDKKLLVIPALGKTVIAYKNND